jgi:hypothetical protein
VTFITYGTTSVGYCCFIRRRVAAQFQLPVISDTVAERVLNASDYQEGTTWDRMPPEFAALARSALVLADRIRKEAQVSPFDPGDIALRSVGITIAIILEQLDSDNFVSEMAAFDPEETAA